MTWRALFFGAAGLVLLLLLGGSPAAADFLPNDTSNETYDNPAPPPDNDGYVIANSSVLTLKNYTKWSTTGDTAALSVYAADLDNDGVVELVTGGSTNWAAKGELRVWNYDASGRLTLKNSSTSQGIIWSVHAADVDNDGIREIIAAGDDGLPPGHGKLSVWNYTAGRLNLESSATWASGGDSATAYTVQAADVDKDGILEIITGGSFNPSYLRQSTSQVRIWNHTGGRLNLEASKEWRGPSHAFVHSLYASDVDNDAATEVLTSGFVVSSFNAAQLGILGYPGGSLNIEKLTEWSWRAYTDANSVYASDVDNDGTMEILTGGFTGGMPGDDGSRYAQLRIWNYLFSGTFNIELSTQWQNGGNTQISSVYASDVDLDGKPDILTFGNYRNGTKTDGQLRIWNWNGSVLFLENLDDWHEASSIDPGAAESLTAADLDGDGAKEIILAGSVGTWPNRQAFVRIYDFGPEHPIEVPTHKVAYLPVKYADRPEPSFTIADLEQRAKKATDYYKQQSFGKANIGYTLVGNGNWITLDRNFSYFGSPQPEDFDKWDNIRDYAISFSGINTSQYDAVMVIQPENVRAYTAMEGRKIVMYQNRTFSTWAHELGHALFKFKDYYSDTDISKRLSNGGDVGYWDLMGEGNKMNPLAPLMSYNKLSAGWLNQTFIAYGEHSIPLLSKLSFGDNVKIFETLLESYIFEGRYPPDGIGRDPEATDLNLELYADEGIELYIKNIFGKLYAIPHNKIDEAGVTLLPGEIYRDDWAAVEFSAKKRDSQLYIDIQPTTIIGRKIISLLGITAEISNSSVLAEAPQVNASEDYDLHVYSYDGKHVGMNYTTGEYELGIENATTSGNLPGGGPEWISVPDNVKVFYTIDATSARRWAKELNVTLVNITATWQVVEYNGNGTRTASEAKTSNVSLEEPTSIGIAASVDIQPDSLNLKSKGNWITTYIELPKEYDVSKIDIGTVRLGYSVPAENSPKYGFVKNPEITDRDGNGVLELMVKFDRSTVQKLIKQTGMVELTLTGEVADKNGVPIPFKGSDTINVVK